jgi:hypothetical protein
MSERLHCFRSTHCSTVVALPFDMEEMIDGWQALRSRMAKQLPQGFERDEWAYLVAFLDRNVLMKPFLTNFGDYVDANGDFRADVLVRPRGNVGIWLPNNVSLLGPLMMVMASLSGNSLRLKAGSQGENLTENFYNFIVTNSENNSLREFVEERIVVERFEREDPRNKDLAAQSDVRIVFGSDGAALAIDAMPHPAASQAVHFVERQSEAWIEKGRIDGDLLATIIKVFAIGMWASLPTMERCLPAGTCRCRR